MPDIRLAREGPQSGNWQWASVKRVPRAASRSILGVLASGCVFKTAGQLFKSSIEIKRTLGFVLPHEMSAEAKNKARVILFLIIEVFKVTIQDTRTLWIN